MSEPSATQSGDVNDHSTNNPPPPTNSATDAETESYRDGVNQYTKNWILRYTHIPTLSAEILWADFTVDYSEMTIHNLNDNNVLQLRSFLSASGIYVEAKRGLNRETALRNVLNAETCPAAPTQSTVNPTPDILSPSNIPQINPNLDKTHLDKDMHQSRKPSVSTGDQNGQDRAGQKHDTSNQDFSRSNMVRGLESLSKSYQGRPKYSGEWDEDLLGILETFDLTCDLCQLSDEQNKKGIVVMLTGTALNYFATKVRGASCSGLEDVYINGTYLVII